MANGLNTIEFNGKRYDALTGAFLGEGKAAAAVVPASVARHRGRSIDGFVKKQAAHSVKKTGPKRSRPTAISQAVDAGPGLEVIPVRPAPPPPAPETSRTIRQARQPKSMVAHSPEHAKTLMRHTVKKPTVTMKPALKAQLPSELAVPQPGAIAPKLSVAKVDPSRKNRALSVSRSTAIQKFSPNRSKQPETVRPSLAAARSMRAAVAAAPSAVATLTQSVAPQTEQDIFEAAIAHATSHEQPAPAIARKHHARRRRFVNILAGVGAFLFIASLVGYLNLSKIELKIASFKAGFHASLPGYQPLGFALQGGVQAVDNHVSMNFRALDDNSEFKLTQQPSSWNSATLYDNIVAIASTQSQTVESGGRTIYIWGDGNATWVNGGVWYQLKGTAHLTTDQITHIATSM